MDRALNFKDYDYKFEFGVGGHNLYHGALAFPETLRWLWKDYND
jgi:enterochelin esterase family protein